MGRFGRGESAAPSGQKKRELILDVIGGQIGIHKSAICRETGLSWGTVTHHLRVLMTTNRIRCFRAGTQAHFALVDDVQTNRLGRALLMPHSRDILSLVEEGDVLGPTTLAKRLGVSPKVVRRHCAMLIEDGHLESDGGYHPRFWLSGSR